MTRIIVTGGRDFDDVELLDRVLDTLHQEQPITVLAQGGAKGADSLAADWCARKMPRVEVRVYDAFWRLYGRRAGPERNGRMLDDMALWGPTRLVVAFPGGRGTEDCVRQAKSRNLVVVRAFRDGTTINIMRDDT